MIVVDKVLSIAMSKGYGPIPAPQLTPMRCRGRLRAFPDYAERVFVMAGFLPAIHAFGRGEKDVDGREHQGVYTPSNDGL